MRSNLGRACAAAAGLMTLLVPNTAFASWWDGGYQPARRHQPPPSQPPPSQPAPDQPPPNQPPSGQPPSGGYGSEQPAPGQQPPSGGYGSEQPAPEQPPANNCCHGQPPAPPPAPVALPSIYGCENSDIPGTRRVLHKQTTPPEGTTVHPGDEIVVEITWTVTDWIAPDLHKALDCVYIDNRYVPQLSGGERPTPNDGHFAYRYVVPADVRPGSTICDQGFVSGPNGEEEYGREVSNLVCFPVGPTPSVGPPPVERTTTTTTTVEQPPTEQSNRYDQQVPPDTQPVSRPAPVVRARDELPRTGGDANPARLAAGALTLALLGRTGSRRRSRLRRP